MFDNIMFDEEILFTYIGYAAGCFLNDNLND